MLLGSLAQPGRETADLRRTCLVTRLETLHGLFIIYSYALITISSEHKGAGFHQSKKFHERRTVMMNLALIDALSYGAIFIFIMIGILGMCMEMGLRR